MLIHTKRMSVKAFAQIDDSIGLKELADLHTHLLGMGDSGFWIDTVIDKIIPYLSDMACKDIIPVEYNPNELDNQLEDSDSGKRNEEFKKNRKKYKNFTYDVVYSLDDLYTAFGENFDKAASEVTKINSIQNRLGTRVKLNEIVKDYTVFNARTQKFEVDKKGILNQDFRDQFLRQKDNRGMLMTAFEMAGGGENGEGPATPFGIKLNFWHQFTPEFFPRRYILKDSMYSQYPFVLDALLQYVLDQYKQNGVSYVEFSIGVGDLIQRPWIYRHLASPQFPTVHWANYELSIPELTTEVQYFFLAGFNRGQVDRNLVLDPQSDRFDSDAIFYCEMLTSKPEKLNTYFNFHLKQLDSVEKAFQNSRSDADSLPPQYCDKLLHNMCVGFDYFGDEYGHPFCPFMLPKFTAFLCKERKQRRNNFGFRYHCGEADQALADKFLLAHMGVSSFCIAEILRACPRESEDTPPPLRIGHGIAFRHYITGKAVTGDHPDRYESALEKYICNALVLFKKQWVPIEVNLTSNDYLKGSAKHAEILKQFLNQEFVVVLATDNDGICPTIVGKYRLVAGEFAGAIHGKTTRIDHPLNDLEVRQIIEFTKNSCFGVWAPIEASNSKAPSQDRFVSPNTNSSRTPNLNTPAETTVPTSEESTPVKAAGTQGISGGVRPAVVKLIETDVHSNDVIMNIEGFDKLKSIDEPLHLIAVSGNGRIGKSWFMNYTAHALDPSVFPSDTFAFQVRAGTDACTTGVDMLMPLFDLSDSTTQIGAKVGLLDLEGCGDRGAIIDTSVMVPAFLTCQIIMFHTKLSVRDSVLESIQTFCEPLRKMLNEDGTKYKLGHLWIVCRDSIDDSKNWERYILDSENTPSATGRNAVRTSLADMFTSVNCCCLPMACEQKYFLQYKNCDPSYPPLHLASEEWKLEMKVLIGKFKEQLRDIPERRGVVLTGSGACELWKHMSSKRNESVSLSEAQALLFCNAMYREITQQAMASLENDFQLQWVAEVFKIILNSKIDLLMKKFNMKTDHIIRTDVRNMYQEQLREEFVPIYSAKATEFMRELRLDHLRKKLEVATHEIGVRARLSGSATIHEIKFKCEVKFMKEITDNYRVALTPEDLKALEVYFFSNTLKNVQKIVVLDSSAGYAFNSADGIRKAHILFQLRQMDGALDILKNTVIPLDSLPKLVHFISMVNAMDEDRAHTLSHYAYIVYGKELFAGRPHMLLYLMEDAAKRGNKEEAQMFLSCVADEVHEDDEKSCFHTGFGILCTKYFDDVKEAIKYLAQGAALASTSKNANYVYWHYYDVWLRKDNFNFEEAQKIFTKGLTLFTEETEKANYADSYITKLLARPEHRQYAEGLLTNFVVSTSAKGISHLLTGCAVVFAKEDNVDRANEYFNMAMVDDFQSSNRRAVAMMSFAMFWDAKKKDTAKAEYWFKKALKFAESKIEYDHVLEAYNVFLIEQDRHHEVRVVPPMRMKKVQI